MVGIADDLRGLKFSRPSPTPLQSTGPSWLQASWNTTRAIEMSVFVVRAFVRLRGGSCRRQELAAKLAALERKVASHDRHIRALFDAIRQLMAPPEKPRKRIGFADGGQVLSSQSVASNETTGRCRGAGAAEDASKLSPRVACLSGLKEDEWRNLNSFNWVKILFGKARSRSFAARSRGRAVARDLR